MTIGLGASGARTSNADSAPSTCVRPAARAQHADQLAERGCRPIAIRDLDHQPAVDRVHGAAACEERDIADPGEHVLLEIEAELGAKLLLDRRAAERARRLLI